MTEIADLSVNYGFSVMLDINILSWTIVGKEVVDVAERLFPR